MTKTVTAMLQVPLKKIMKTLTVVCLHCQHHRQNAGDHPMHRCQRQSVRRSSMYGDSLAASTSSGCLHCRGCLALAFLHHQRISLAFLHGHPCGLCDLHDLHCQCCRGFRDHRGSHGHRTRPTVDENFLVRTNYDDMRVLIDCDDQKSESRLLSGHCDRL